jgi:hypothetical protein
MVEEVVIVVFIWLSGLVGWRSVLAGFSGTWDSFFCLISYKLETVNGGKVYE